MNTSKPRTLVLAGLAFAGIGLSSAAASAADITVSPGESIPEAIGRANPGDRVLVRAGVYPGGGWIERSGTAEAPIQVVSVDGPQRAVIEGGDEPLRVGGASSHLVFDGFEIRNGRGNVIHVDGGSHHLTFRNIFAHDAGSAGDVMKVNQSHHIVVERSAFARPGARTGDAADNPFHECLDFVDVDDSVVRDSHFYDGGSMLLFVKGGSRRVVIERNTFSQQRAGASDPMVGLGGPTDPELLAGEQYEATDITFRNNVVMNGLTGAIAVYDADRAFISNNLFLNNDRVLIEFRAGEGPAGKSNHVRVVDNLMVDTRGRMPEPYRLSSHGLTDFATSHNLFWNAGYQIPGSSLVDVASQPGHLEADPQVRVPGATAGRDQLVATVRPAAGSPAWGSGLAADVPDDLTGAPRHGRRDRGPFVMTSAAATGGATPAPGGGATCPPEATTPDAEGNPRNAAGQVRQCWPGEAQCVCDADNDCYADEGYVACR